MGSLHINRYMVAMAIGLGIVAGRMNLHGDLAKLLFPAVVCFLMIAGSIVGTRLQGRSRGHVR